MFLNIVDDPNDLLVSCFVLFCLFCLRGTHRSHAMYCINKPVLLTNTQTAFLVSVPLALLYKFKCSPSFLSLRELRVNPGGQP